MATITKKAKTEIVECWKCLGSGYIKAFSHIESGVCFTCGGTGKKETRVKTESQKGREASKRAEKEAYHAKKREEFNEKISICVSKYANDSRLRVQPSHQYYETHVYELAVKDGFWETL